MYSDFYILRCSACSLPNNLEINLSDMRVLVTGAAGFIGSAVSRSLVELGHTVFAVDNFSDYYDVSLKNARVDGLLKPVDLEVHELDISNQKVFSKFVKIVQPQLIVHLGLPNQECV